MAHFMATVQGRRGSASRLGDKASGIETKANGWKSGIRVKAHHRDGKDVFKVFATAGSESPTSAIIGTFSQEDGWQPAD